MMTKIIHLCGIVILSLVVFLTSSPVEAAITCTVSVNSAISDLSANNLKENSIDLAWTTPNIKSLKSSYFDIRYSKVLILPENWDDANRAIGEPKLIPGAHQKMKVKNLEDNTTYYFALRTVGIDGLNSPLSNITLATTLDKTANSVSRFEKWLRWKWW